MKNLSGLTKQELKLEKIVDKIKSLTILEGIVILKEFRGKIERKAWRNARHVALLTAAEHAKVKFVHDPDNFKTGGYYVVDQDSILKLMK